IHRGQRRCPEILAARRWLAAGYLANSPGNDGFPSAERDDRTRSPGAQNVLSRKGRRRRGGEYLAKIDAMKILIVHHHRFEVWHAPAWLRERLQKEFPRCRFVQLEDYQRVPVEIGDAEVFIGWSLRPEQLVAARKLRWIHSPAAAVHQLMFPELIRSDLIVTNSTGVHGPVVAEHALATLLALAKRLPQAMSYQAQKGWAQERLWKERPRPPEVE